MHTGKILSISPRKIIFYFNFFPQSDSFNLNMKKKMQTEDKICSKEIVSHIIKSVADNR